ncbi:tryptophan 2,3-dioxygenase family protein [Streptomyces fumanus]|uniref:tryptophan 2,3-dioxygenase family protein n=1 Tax=Streptomyces fumanus TaxID=67302 RepID=UPI0034009B22
MPESAYARYLMLPELLRLQHPRSGSQEDDVRASENFFIVVHQSAELLAQQTIIDLEAVVRAGEQSRCDWAGVESRLNRALGLMEFLRHHLTVLEHLPREHFLAFRERLGTASGHQSEQFATIFAVLDGRDDGEPGGGVPAFVTERLAALRQAVHDWRAAHIALVRRMIGDAPGTGGTAGAAWLRSRQVPARPAQESTGPVLSVSHPGRTAAGG